MGMFDNVDYECICPVCNNKVTGFQSKSGDCVLDTVKPTEVKNFYSSCDKCGCWIDFEAKEVANFVRTVTSMKNGERNLIPQHTKELHIKG